MFALHKHLAGMIALASRGGSNSRKKVFIYYLCKHPIPFFPALSGHAESFVAADSMKRLVSTVARTSAKPRMLEATALPTPMHLSAAVESSCWKASIEAPIAKKAHGANCLARERGWVTRATVLTSACTHEPEDVDSQEPVDNDEHVEHKQKDVDQL